VDRGRFGRRSRLPLKPARADGERFVPDRFAPRAGPSLPPQGDRAQRAPTAPALPWGARQPDQAARLPASSSARSSLFSPATRRLAGRVAPRPRMRATSRRSSPMSSRTRATRGTPTALRRFAREHLPAYMVPPRSSPCSRCRRHRTAKVDGLRCRSRLPARSGGRAGEAVRGRATPPPGASSSPSAGKVLASGTRSASGDDFFEIGVDSLTAPAAFTRMERDLAAAPALSAVFEAPTVNASPRLSSRRGRLRALVVPRAAADRSGSRLRSSALHRRRGHGPFYNDLVRSLRTTSRWYAFQAAGSTVGSPCTRACRRWLAPTSPELTAAVSHRPVHPRRVLLPAAWWLTRWRSSCARAEPTCCSW